LKIYTTFKDVQMILKRFFDISTGFRFSKISVECSVHLCSCPFLSQASFNLRNKAKDTMLRMFFKHMTRPIVSQKNSAAEAEGRLPKNLGIGRLCSASVIP
jgi:hypothetical protein